MIRPIPQTEPPPVSDEGDEGHLLGGTAAGAVAALAMLLGMALVLLSFGLLRPVLAVVGLAVGLAGAGVLFLRYRWASR